MTTDAVRDELEVDLAVIGFGKGGKTLAGVLGTQGWRVVMIEQSPQMYGGTCINTGCVPTKSLVFQSEHLNRETAHHRAFRAAEAATTRLTDSLRSINFAALDELDTVTVLTGRGYFTDPHTVRVETLSGPHVTVNARWVVIDTGSQPVYPPIPGLRDTAAVYDSAEMLGLDELPDRLTVLGGGYIGLEFAAMFAAYGCAVTVVERGSEVLAHEDDDVAKTAREILASCGVAIKTAADVTAVDHSVHGVTVRYLTSGATRSVDADAVLVALGRRPATENLGLDVAGVAVDSAGAVVVDDVLRTTQHHIFAVGDVNGGPQFTYISLDDYRIVLSQLAGDGKRSTAGRLAVPYTLFMTPPLARVGLTEKAARQMHAIKVAAMRVADMATMPRARIVDQTSGMMKVVVDADTDEILGAALLSYDAHEVINTVALAMRHGITAGELRDAIYTHPSMTEGFNQLLSSL